VELQLDERGDQIVLIVRDSGIGIAAKDLPYVFERFWRADLARSRTGERPGTGLGLAITKWIAEAHGGSIAVQSRLTRGSVFTVTLPGLIPDTLERGSASASASNEPSEASSADSTGNLM
jgi:signal transduction histidine kinase